MVDGARFEFPLILKVDEEVEDAFRWQLGEFRLWVVVGELNDPAVVGFTGALGESFELDKASEVLIPLS